MRLIRKRRGDPVPEKKPHGFPHLPPQPMTHPRREDLLAGFQTLRRARGELRRLGFDNVLSVLDDVRHKWLDPSSPWFGAVTARMAQSTGFHPKMIAHALPFHFEPLGPRAIRELLEEELGEASRPWKETDASPQTLVHVLAGNLPGLAAWPVFLTLAIGAAAVVKPASGDPLFPHLLWESLHAVSPVVAEAVWVLPWKGGYAPVEELVFREADVVVAQGRNSTLATLASRAPGKLIGHGERVSFAFVGREMAEEPELMREAARRVAYDVAVWDQRGCRSPHVCFVECLSPSVLIEFGRCLAEESARWAEELPPRQRSMAEQVAVRRFRDETQWSGNQLLYSEGDLSWSIAVESRPSLNPTCGNRCLRLQPVRSAKELRGELAPHVKVIEAAGLVVVPNRFVSLSAELHESGVPSVVEAGTMQRPTLQWKPGGRPRVAEWWKKRSSE